MIKYKKRDSLEGHGFAAAVFYGVCSASMAFLNKAVISSYEFPFPFFIMACQMMVTILFLEILGSLGKVTLPHYTWRSARLFLAPSLGYAFHATLSLMALQGMNIPMYGAVKRCTPLVNLVLSVVILHRPYPSCTLISSILIITSGCFVAALGDLTIDTFAYTMGGLSVLAQGLYLTLVQQCAENKLSTLEILQLNSYNTLAPFIIVSVLMGEPEAIVKSQYLTDIGFHLTFWTLVSLGSVLNYSLFLCTALNSALTTSLVSVAKSVIQTLVGFFVFGGVKYHPLNITGIVMNTVGGFMYTYTKYQEGKKKYQKDENYNKLQLNGVVSTPREAPLIPNGIKRDEHSLNEIKVS
ncbi:UDP-galactose/UDP-glucose transporter 7-like isoform X1 [Penaeus chinensis]|uniref:UDP-galactose/UDP-glucose transporter 7-like isoform X1 n=1 Tax=Penaeus chinensis TaxID=139456 RepID=UPI001FB6B50C|nr:UDP-galactose/UDP-glucose transporter 7-like isoform X1 [Penaeus chinensis]